MDENKLNNQQKFNRWAIKFIALMIIAQVNLRHSKMNKCSLKSHWWKIKKLKFGNCARDIESLKKLNKPSRVISWPQSTLYLALDCRVSVHFLWFTASIAVNRIYIGEDLMSRGEKNVCEISITIRLRIILQFENV